MTLLTNVGAGNSAATFSLSLSNLTPGVSYNYRAVASNFLGQVTSAGAVEFFAAPAFTNLPTPFPAVANGSAAWGDYDNDGLLDLLITGQTSTGAVSQVWRNTGTGFTNVTAYAAPGLPRVVYGSVAWGDYDNDGRLDFLITGYADQSGMDVSQLWHNTGNGFTNVPIPGLPGLEVSSVAWGDLDNDGLLDFLIIGYGYQADQATSQLWRNTGNGFTNVTATIAPGLPQLAAGSVAWEDYDGDGRLDFLITGGINEGAAGFAQLWRNTGNGFVNVTPSVVPQLPGVFYSSVAWGDFNNDGRPDFLIIGQTNNYSTSSICQLWQNTGSGFTNVTSSRLPEEFPGVSQGTVAWGDYDNDGRPDLFVTGQSQNGYPFFSVLRNTGTGFEDVTEDVAANSPSVSAASAAWGDFNHDGRLDLFVMGATNPGYTSPLWENISATNTPPNAPTGLSVAVNPAGGLTFSWNSSTDAQTPAAGLTYNLRIGTTPGGSDVLSPMAANNGFRRLAAAGTVPASTAALFNYRLNTPYYWSVQAIDGAFAGSPFATEGSFRILGAPQIVPTATTTLIPGDANLDGKIDDSEFANALASLNLNGNGIVTQSNLDVVLANYWPYSPWLAMTNVAGLGGTNVTFALSNSVAGAFSVEYSTNLVDWQFLGLATQRYLFTDTNAPASSQRYYRLRWP